ncbi:YwdI family protein [Neobacillus massiliamazoniensis]|uniref:YwdI n=1 Tax=Neobacillus massiliamazoniensis TaxID=1499688 RepID=A0A0U1NX32_9BACI|nr:YwdI family protein [Neobacillus massiliamazoniensis]CRK82580.1 YwdI [Neobacillus massiliamazoniensis]
MNISVKKLLAKIEEELQLAKNSPQEESLREKIYSIKILCELILAEKHAVTAQTIQPVIPQPTGFNQQIVFQQPVPINQPKKLEVEDGANGDSLFDF